MGYRFRKSVNLGCGFKINLSKSGIGYSWGIPGMRYSKLSNEREKYTYSIPGTGISYVGGVSSVETRQNDSSNTQSSLDNVVEEKISSTDFVENSDCDEFINRINEFCIKDKCIKISIVLLTLILLGVFKNPVIVVGGLITLGVYLICRNSKMLISVEYDFDDENKRFYETINNFFETIISAERLWLIEAEYKNSDIKHNAGADSCVERLPVSITEKIPYYIRTNIKCYCLSIKDKDFYFLPNKVLVHNKNKTVGLNFQELHFEFNETTFVEQLGAPSDCEIVGYTYRYVNKKGGPDRRYKDNPKYPKCLYGKIDIKNDYGLNLSILLSSKAKTIQAQQIYNTLKSINICTTKKCISCGKNISVGANFCKYCGIKQ